MRRYWYENRFFILMQIKVIFMTKVLHLTSFWKKEFLKPGNGTLVYSFQTLIAPIHVPVNCQTLHFLVQMTLYSPKCATAAYLPEHARLGVLCCCLRWHLLARLRPEATLSESSPGQWVRGQMIQKRPWTRDDLKHRRERSAHLTETKQYNYLLQTLYFHSKYTQNIKLDQVRNWDLQLEVQFAFTGSAEYWNIPNGFRYNYPASVVFGI